MEKENAASLEYLSTTVDESKSGVERHAAVYSELKKEIRDLRKKNKKLEQANSHLETELERVSGQWKDNFNELITVRRENRELRNRSLWQRIRNK